jgi:hypothetical protein
MKLTFDFDSQDFDLIPFCKLYPDGEFYAYWLWFSVLIKDIGGTSYRNYN